MISKYTTTRECSNSEGPYGFHLSDGIVYTYSSGAEHEDIFEVLNYNMPPGITTDYVSTPLKYTTIKQRGMDAYAGRVQTGEIGMVAMQYISPLSKMFSFYKTWLFFPDHIQQVLVANI
ncbi:hypothetical protein OPQ81_001141 [Rhizoctonia solani]|nr:hypothetical protein OPQ81_001141 [Rhizoctonia solani]